MLWSRLIWPVVDVRSMWDREWLETLVANVPGAIYRCVALRALREGTVVGLANHTILFRPDGSEIRW